GLIRINPGAPYTILGLNWAMITLGGGSQNSAFSRYSAEFSPDNLSVFKDAGFNMMRMKGGSGHSGLVDANGTKYYPETWIAYDERMKLLKKIDMRVFYGIFGNRYPHGMSSPMTQEQKDLVKMSIAWWGAYVDIWELQNEKLSDSTWVSEVTQYVKAHDPYSHPVTQSSYFYDTNPPDNPDIDINNPHLYVDDNELQTDRMMANLASNWKSYNKPVFVGEQGNQSQSWQKNSAVRMRIRLWASFFNEISIFLFPNNNTTTWSASGASNIWLGSLERQYTQILQRFSEAVIHPDMVMMNVEVSTWDMRAYGLSSGNGVALYLHHHSNNTGTLSGETVTFECPVSGQGYWIDPITGNLLGSATVNAGSNQITVPDFIIDIAFLSTASDFEQKPIAIINTNNTQWAGSGGDLDGDGLVEMQPDNLPFGKAPLTIEFDATQSIDWDGDSLNYSWNFGDGVTATGPIQSHTFNDRGSFLVQLTVTDDEGHRVRQSLCVLATADLNPDINDAPIWISYPDITVIAGDIVFLEPGASDKELINGSYTDSSYSNLTYTASNLPQGAQFLKHNEDAGKISANRFWWLPNFDQVGQHTIQLDVTDVSGATPPPQFITINVLDTTDCTSTNMVEINTPKQVLLYPNPASSILNIKSEKQAPTKFTLFNILGEKMLSGTILHNDFIIDISEFNDGIYILRIDDKSFKIIKN
ncbi:PKD domain-containing protein, partial [Bacteroidota bacterium]